MKENKTICDLCGKKFTAHDEYTNAHGVLTFVRYMGDDGSLDIKLKIDICRKCLCDNKNLSKIFKEE